MTKSALRLSGIRKAYGNCVANDCVDLDVPRGSIRGILGENGAGKSTAMKIAYGMIEADEGTIAVDNVVARLDDPMTAKSLGIGMVHQHFMLSEAQTVWENIVLGNEPRRGILWPKGLSLLNESVAKQKLQLLMSEYGLDLPLDTLVEDLSVGQKQRVEILKLLYNDARILILDEPTAVLTPQEVASFFQQLRKLAAEGRTILIVTHKLRELLTICDEISIFRAGRVLTTVKAADVDADSLAALMIGKRLEPVKNLRPGRSSETPILVAKNLLLRAGKDFVDFQIYPGEILGLAGIERNGQDELVAALRQPRSVLGGSVEFLGRDVRDWSAAQMIAAGVACIPADRHREALLLDESAVRNFALGYQDHPDFRLGPFLRWKAIRQATLQGMKACGVVPEMPDMQARGFSGGNQQKLIFAREIHHGPKLLIAMHPTRGVDIGAIQLIHARLMELKAAGVAILLISSELDEILSLADRIQVMENFRLTATFAAGACDETALGLAMSGRGHA